MRNLILSVAALSVTACANDPAKQSAASPSNGSIPSAGTGSAEKAEDAEAKDSKRSISEIWAWIRGLPDPFSKQAVYLTQTSSEIESMGTMLALANTPEASKMAKYNDARTQWLVCQSMLGKDVDAVAAGISLKDIQTAYIAEAKKLEADMQVLQMEPTSSKGNVVIAVVIAEAWKALKSWRADNRADFKKYVAELSVPTWEGLKAKAGKGKS